MRLLGMVATSAPPAGSESIWAWLQRQGSGPGQQGCIAFDRAKRMAYVRANSSLLESYPYSIKQVGGCGWRGWQRWRGWRG